MRVPHGGKPFHAVGARAPRCYSGPMNTATRLSSTLRLAAIVILVAILGLWIATGAHLGWTQTSRIVLQHDDITGIDFPVRQKTFVAGIELLLAGAGFSAALAGAGHLARRRRAIRA